MNTLQPGHIHIAGVGGIATSALAAELVRRGYRVSGSDEYVLPPAAQVLADCGLVVPDGYEAAQVDASVDLAVIGAFLGADNPVVGEILRRKIRHLSWPRLLGELGLLAPHNGVVAGTNGKTSTSCMWAWIMEKTGHQPDHVIGGRLADWPTGVRLRGARHCILEGDEYPCGLGDRNPKFVHYQPEAAILLNVHFDHADVFSNEREVVSCYRLLVDLLPPGGVLIYNGDDSRCRKLAAAACCRTLSFGISRRAQARLEKVRHEKGGITFALQGAEFSLPLWGNFNALNAAAAALAAESWGVPLLDSAEALRDFPGALKRQERLRVDDSFALVADTAYHPDAVDHLLGSLRDHFPGRPLGLVLQPRHTTGPANWQQRRWPRALRHASKVIVMDHLNHPSKDRNLFSAAALCTEIRKRGIPVCHAGDAAGATQHFKKLASAGDVWVLCLENWFAEPRGEIVAWSGQITPVSSSSIPCASSLPSVN